MMSRPRRLLPGPLVLALLLLAIYVVPARAAAAAPESTAKTAKPPPPDPEALGPRAPTPAYDVGVLAGVCGVGQSSVWQGTEFCGALLGDVLWLRKTPTSVGLGAFVSAGTAGFYDFRPSAGVSLHVPMGRLFSLGARFGPLVHVMGDAALPGFVAAAEFGIRTLNHSGHYSLTHGLVVGWDQSFGTGSRAGSALTIALRVDGFWLAAPIGMLF
jgi:hypothetical protein